MKKFFAKAWQYRDACIITCTALIVGQVSIIYPAQAQPANTSSAVTPHGRISPDNFVPNKNNPEFRSEKLTGLIEMPNLPTFTGKIHFISGINFPNVPGGASATMRFATTASPQEVLDWYRLAFKQSDWILSSESTNNVRIGAMRDKQICQVLVMRPARSIYPKDRDRYACDVVLRYKF